jgi:hypothetical protein
LNAMVPEQRLRHEVYQKYLTSMEQLICSSGTSRMYHALVVFVVTQRFRVSIPVAQILLR